MLKIKLNNGQIHDVLNYHEIFERHIVFTKQQETKDTLVIGKDCEWYNEETKFPDLIEPYKQWCAETKRNGGVLVGGSMLEFFEWLKNKNI